MTPDVIDRHEEIVEEVSERKGIDGPFLGRVAKDGIQDEVRGRREDELESQGCCYQSMNPSCLSSGQTKRDMQSALYDPEVIPNSMQQQQQKASEQVSHKVQVPV